MTAVEGQVRSALRWHSSRWRKHNEEHVVGMYLSKADDEGWRELPDDERRRVVRQGLRERLRWGIPAALGILLVVVFATWTTVSVLRGPVLLTTALWAWASPVVLILAIASYISALSNVVSRRGVIGTAVGVIASLLLSFSWTIGWMRDDAITAGTTIPLHYFWFAIAAYVLTFCMALLIYLGGALERAGVPAPLAIVSALLGGVVSSAAFAFVALVPFVTVVAGLTITVLSLVAHRRMGPRRRRTGFVPNTGV